MQGTGYWFLLAFLHLAVVDTVETPPQCLTATDVPQCDCEEGDTGLLLECRNTNQKDLEKMVKLVKDPVQVLSIYDLSPDITHWPRWILSNVSVVNFKITGSSLKVTLRTIIKSNRRLGL